MLDILKKYTILYVEDEDKIQKNIEEYLNNFFQKVYVSSSGDIALDMYNKYKPDVLLLDINIPNIDGLELAKMIRQKDDDVKIIIITAHTQKDKLLKATQLNLLKYMVKPVSPKIFKETLELLSNKLLNHNSNYIHLCDNIIWDKQNNILTKNNKTINLLEKEMRLLKLFIKKQNTTVFYDEIMNELWDNALFNDISIDSVKNQVSHLRKKLNKNIILSVYSQGYKLITNY